MRSTALAPDRSQRPPTVTSSTELPFENLDWTKFERLCQDLARGHDFTDVHRHGKPGQPQDGVDFTGVSPEGVPTGFQVRRRAVLTASELRAAVQEYAEGALAPPRTEAFVVCLSAEGSERKLQDELAALNDRWPFPITLWDAVELTHRLRSQRDLVQTYFGEGWVASFFAETPSPNQRLNTESLLLGPIAALGLARRVEEAQGLAETSPADAARLYGEIADALRERFPGHADRFELLRATALKDAGDSASSHDLLMELATRNLFERAEPQLPSGVTRGLQEIHDTIDEVRRARGAAVILFEQWHERPDALEGLAASFDDLGPDDHYAPFIAALLGEAALADRAFQLVLDREAKLRVAGDHADETVALRIRLALADASGAWQELAGDAESLRFPTAEGSYVCLRAARWYAWDGQLERAESFYRLAMKLGAEVGFDLDAENALWSLTRIYAFPDRADELLEANKLALSIHGSRSYVPANSRTRERAYRDLANGKMPGAHLWSRSRLLQAIRSGCLMDELEAHAVLARVYSQSAEPLAALEHATLGGARDLVKDLASQLGVWPDFLAGLVGSPAPWVRSAALSVLEWLGDLAPPEVARGLAHDLIQQLHGDAGDMEVDPALLQALSAVVIEATDDDLGRLMPVLEQLAPRELDGFRLTDPGVGILAARLYRFRPALRQRAAAILGEMATGVHTNDWVRALNECGEDVGELIAAFERVARREGVDLAGPLSDLGHLNDATRALWSSRLRFVAEHPLGQRSEYKLLSRYDVPPNFLREQSAEVVHRYVDKLVAIGGNSHEAIINRAEALRSATNGVNLLPADSKSALFGTVLPLTDQRLSVSELDRYQASTQHPLSRFQFAFGTATDVRAAAGWLLGRVATSPNECSAVTTIALDWSRSENPILQQHGALLLTFPNLSADAMLRKELIMHTNPLVRREGLRASRLQASVEPSALERLAFDPDRGVRIEVAHALHHVRETDPESYARIRGQLVADPSALVRAIAVEVLGSP